MTSSIRLMSWSTAGLLGIILYSLINSMPETTYSLQQLNDFRSSLLWPTRSVRKILFKYQLWNPQNHPSLASLPSSASSSAPSSIAVSASPLLPSSPSFKSIRRLTMSPSSMMPPQPSMKSQLDVASAPSASMPLSTHQSLAESSSVRSSSPSASSSTLLTSQPLATNSSLPPSSFTSSVIAAIVSYYSSGTGSTSGLLECALSNGQACVVMQSLLEGNLDLLAVTESWHHCSEDSSILRATPAGYSSRDNPRQLLPDVGPAGGGGIVVFFKSSLRVTQVQLTLVPSSFEALCLSIATPRGPVTLLTVYRPSTTTLTLQFYEEFASMLEDLITRNSQLLILGDFNIHLEDSASSNSLHFSQLLAQFGLHQHISEPTRDSGGWLDLVINSDEEQILT